MKSETAVVVLLEEHVLLISERLGLREQQVTSIRAANLPGILSLILTQEDNGDLSPV